MQGLRQLLRRGIGVPLHGARPTQHIFSQARTVFARLVSPTGIPRSAQPALPRPPQSHTSRFTLPARHALPRPFSAPRLPKPPAVPANVTHVGLGTARAFHSGRPIFQNMVDNVPIATRALWEAEWEIKMKKKEARKMRRATQNKTVPKSPEMLKPITKPVVAEPRGDLDAYFPVLSFPPVTTHLLVPLAPTPTARLPLSVRTDGGDAHPLLPIADLGSIHSGHRLHSLRVSSLFARLDTANVWDDPGVNVGAYAFCPRHDVHDVREKQCTVLRVTFRGWDANRVRSILGGSAEQWYSLQETHLDEHPAVLPSQFPRQGMLMHSRSESPSLESLEADSASAAETDYGCDGLLSPPLRACASAQHDLVLPTLNFSFSSAFSDAMDNLPSPPEPLLFLRTISELSCDAELASQSPSAPVDLEGSWGSFGSDTSSTQRVGDWDDVAQGIYCF